MSDAQSLAHLEAFLLDNQKLEQLEMLLDSFNIFEAIGMVRQETRHSHLLSILLDPKQKHGLGDRFLKRFLQSAIGNANRPLAISAVELAVTDLSTMRVQREWQNIDIFLRNDAAKIAVIIENKVDSTEHGNQLKRYWNTVAQHFPGWRVLALLLTPDGVQPSEAAYVSIDYGTIVKLLLPFTNTQKSALTADVQTLLRHYIDMLQRHIMSDSEIANLCRRIYAEHRQALDLIFEHRPDVQRDLHDYLVGLIEASDIWQLKWSRKSLIEFRPKAWLGSPYHRSGTAQNLQTFSVYNQPNRLRLAMTINPGVLDHRQQLLDVAIANRKAGFSVQTKKLNKNWNRIFTITWFSAKDYEELSLDEMFKKVDEQWARFEQKVWPKLEAVVEPVYSRIREASNEPQ